MNHAHTPISKRTKATTEVKPPKAPKEAPLPRICENCTHWNNAEYGDNPKVGVCHRWPADVKSPVNTVAAYYCAEFAPRKVD